ncbi:hypothetical protein TanjilG_28260 [Lupinus angustifolius]|uniref:Uncharacterized protein n=1 Tax=Lupinus angustifolius TaxID=3871 RepID=A0A394DD76_LUPAN|nr:hypothetical protein TanjilG_28260 [Lupinus angustifolius]
MRECERPPWREHSRGRQSRRDSFRVGRHWVYLGTLSEASLYHIRKPSYKDRRSYVEAVKGEASGVEKEGESKAAECFMKNPGTMGGADTPHFLGV